MFFKMTTKLYCEKNCIKNHANDLKQFGKRALIVTGRNSSKLNGSLKDVTTALASIGTDYIIFDKVEENPSVKNIMDASAFGMEFSPDYVIGIGGGSPLDASKAIALMLANPDFDEALLFNTGMGHKNALPVVCVPTTCGTGSEVTPYSILTLHDSKTKSSIPHHIFPEISYADPIYLSFASDTILKNTAVDALGHFIESSINARSSIFADVFCEKGLAMWQTVKEILLKSEKTYEDYETLLNVSSLAGMAISHTGTSLPHGMSYSLTYEHGVAHGKAVGTFLAAYIDNSDEANKNKVLSLLGYNNAAELNDDLKALIGTVRVSKEEYDRYLKYMQTNERKLKSCPFTATADTVSAIYAGSLLQIIH